MTNTSIVVLLGVLVLLIDFPHVYLLIFFILFQFFLVLQGSRRSGSFSFAVGGEERCMQLQGGGGESRG